LEFINTEYGGDQAQYFRQVVSDNQDRNELLGITKQETTMATLDGLHNYIRNNPETVVDIKDYLGWTKVKDASNIAVEDNPEVGQKIRAIEEAHDSYLADVQRKADAKETLATKELFEKHEQTLSEAFSSGKSIDRFTFNSSLKADAGKLGLRNVNVLQSMYEEFASGTPRVDDKAVMQGYGIAFAKGLEKNYPSQSQLDLDYANGKLTYASYKSYTEHLTVVSKAEYKDTMKLIQKTYADPMADAIGKSFDKDYLNENQVKSSKYLGSLVTDEIKKTGAVPNPQRLHELVKQTNEYMKEQPSNDYKGPAYTLAENITSTEKFAKIKAHDPEWTMDKQVKAMVDIRDTAAKVAKQKAAEAVKVVNQPVKPVAQKPVDNTPSIYKNYEDNSLNQIPEEFLNGLFDFFDKNVSPNMSIDPDELNANAMNILEQMKEFPVVRDFLANRNYMKR
jgi:hypothetical protein